MNDLLAQWNKVTGDLKWGAQHVLHETLTAVAENGVHLVHGADYRDGKPCLINAAGSMLTSGGGHGVPSREFGPVVSLFDKINAALNDRGVNDDTGYVSPLAAEVLLRHFAPLKGNPGTPEATVPEPAYIEPSDEEIAKSWLNAMSAPAPDALSEPASDPVDGYNKDFIKSNVHHGIFGS